MVVVEGFNMSDFGDIPSKSHKVVQESAESVHVWDRPVSESAGELPPEKTVTTINFAGPDGRRNGSHQKADFPNDDITRARFRMISIRRGVVRPETVARPRRALHGGCVDEFLVVAVRRLIEHFNHSEESLDARPGWRVETAIDTNGMDGVQEIAVPANIGRRCRASTACSHDDQDGVSRCLVVFES